MLPGRRREAAIGLLTVTRMGAIAALEPTLLSVEPGGEASATLRVRNAGTVVDEFTFEVIGDPAGWTTVEPTVLRLMPDAEDTVRVALRPPRSSDAPAGSMPFAVKVSSKEDPPGSVVEEGRVEVLPFLEVAAELLPRTSQGRRRSRHELAVDNRGNERLNADVLAYDDDELLEFEVADPGLVVDPGQATFTRVDVRPHKRFWRGPEKTLPFHVVVQSTDGIGPVTVEGTMVQRPVLPKWFWKAVLALLSLLLLLALLWYTLLRPTIESSARSAAEEAASEAAAEAADQAVKEGLAGPIAGQQEQLDELTTQGNDLAERLGGEVVEPTSETAPSDVRLAASAGPGRTGTDTFSLGEGARFEMTDVVLQNPTGNVGRLRILRNEQVLLVVALENFRDLDYHFVVPVVFSEGQSLVLQVQCDAVTDEGGSACDAAAYVSGSLTRPLPTDAPA